MALIKAIIVQSKDFHQVFIRTLHNTHHESYKLLKSRFKYQSVKYVHPLALQTENTQKTQ